MGGSETKFKTNVPGAAAQETEIIGRGVPIGGGGMAGRHGIGPCVDNNRLTAG